MPIIIIISLVTILVSIMGFRQEHLFDKLQLNPFQIVHKKEYYRLFTHALLHGDWAHLIINIIVFFSFGDVLLYHLSVNFGEISTQVFLLMYVSSVAISSIYSVYKYKNNPNYNAIGASGAVSAIVFATVLFDPWHKVLFFAVVPIPGFIFAGLYLAYSYYMAKKNIDNIGHDAHFFGAVYGFVFPIILKPSILVTFLSLLFN